MLIATHHRGLCVSPLARANYPSPPAGISPMPSTLIANPGTYRGARLNEINGTWIYESYDLTQPGLYQMLVPYNEKVGATEGNAAYVYNYIVGKDVFGQPDHFALASALAWLISFGGGDSTLTVAQRIAKAQHSNLNLACGNTAEVLASLANQLCIETRYVHVLTGEAITNYNDGHMIVEMKVNGVWKMFDSSLGYIFKDVFGIQLNVYETCEGLMADNVVPERIAPFKYTSEAAVVGKFNVLAWMHAENGWTEEGRVATAKRLYQIPFVNDSNNADPAKRGIWGYLPSGLEDRASYVTGLGYKLLSKEQFIARFYP